jgi:hypothetical protein
VLLFPVLRLESLLKYINSINAIFIGRPTSGKYVYTKCQNLARKRENDKMSLMTFRSARKETNALCSKKGVFQEWFSPFNFVSPRVHPVSRMMGPAPAAEPEDLVSAHIDVITGKR